MKLSSDDRVDLRELADDYARGVDERDVERFVSVFAEDGWLEIYPPGKDPGADAPRDRYAGHEELAAVMELLAGFGETMHLVANHQLEATGQDEATGITTCLAHHLTPREQPEQNLVMHIRYYDRYRRDPDGWRIEGRTVDWLWSELRPLAVLD